MGLHLDQGIRELGTEGTSHTATQIHGSFYIEHALAIVQQREGHAFVSQSNALHQVQTTPQFGRGGLQELAPRRDIEEQVAHLDQRATRTSSGRDRRDGTTFAAHLECTRLRGALRLRLTRHDATASHGTDAGQGFAAKTETGDMLKV